MRWHGNWGKDAGWKKTYRVDRLVSAEARRETEIRGEADDAGRIEFASTRRQMLDATPNPTSDDVNDRDALQAEGTRHDQVAKAKTRVARIVQQRANNDRTRMKHGAGALHATRRRGPGRVCCFATGR